jgi:hypothetical protein
MIKDNKQTETEFLEMTHFDDPSLPYTCDIPSYDFGTGIDVDGYAKIRELESTNKKLKQEVKSLESALDLLLKRYEELGIEITRQTLVEPSWNEPIARVVDYITIPQQKLVIPRTIIGDWKWTEIK